MNKLYEKRVELMLLLNDSMIEPQEEINAIAELFDIKFFHDEHCWDMIGDK